MMNQPQNTQSKPGFWQSYAILLKHPLFLG